MPQHPVHFWNPLSYFTTKIVQRVTLIFLEGALFFSFFWKISRPIFFSLQICPLLLLLLTIILLLLFCFYLYFHNPFGQSPLFLRGKSAKQKLEANHI